MLIFGHAHIPSENFYHVNSIEAIEHTPSNTTLLFSSDEEVFEMVNFAKENSVNFALEIKSLQEAIIFESLDAQYLLVKKELAKKVQNAADTYLFDAKVLVHLEDEENFEDLIEEGIDGVVFSEAIIKIS